MQRGRLGSLAEPIIGGSHLTREDAERFERQQDHEVGLLEVRRDAGRPGLLRPAERGFAHPERRETTHTLVGLRLGPGRTGAAPVSSSVSDRAGRPLRDRANALPSPRGATRRMAVTDL